MKISKIIHKLNIFFIIFFLLVFFNINISYAGVTVSQSNVSMSVGDSKTITLTGNDATGNVAVSSSNTSVATVSISSNWIENNSTTITITGKSAGSATIYITGVVSNSSGSETNINTSINVTVTSNSSSGSSSSGSSSSNSGSNTITSLKVGDKTYSNPNQDITIGSVDAKTDSIVVVPTTSGGVSYTINGGSSTTVPLKTGTNVISIAVSNGKTYKVRITRLAEEPEIQPNIMDEKAEEEQKEENNEENKLVLTSLNVKNYELTPEFNSEVYSYTININMQENDTSKLEIDAIPNIANATVEIIGNDNLAEGENIITILIKAEDKEEPTVYQILVNKIDSSSEIVSNTILDKIGFLSDLNPLQRNLLLGFAGFVLLVVIIVVIVLIRKARKKKKSSIPYEEINRDDKVIDNELIKENIEEKEKIGVDESAFIEDIEENESINETTNTDYSENMSKTNLDSEKAALMDEFFSYNKSIEDDKKLDKEKKVRKKGKGKGKHF